LKKTGFILKKVLPALFGLLIYSTIRAITDSAYRHSHLFDDWHVILIEVSCSILAGYLYVYLINYFSRKKKELLSNEQFSVRNTTKEFGLFYFYVCILTNVTFTVMAASTDDGLSWHDLIMINTIPVFYVFIVFLIIRGNHFVKAYIDNKVQLERLARDKAEEELKFLKGQYQPHFLFNALNTIYFQMDESIQGAKKSIEKLSDLLRYRLYEEDSNTVFLSDELEYLKKYIEFQSIRSSDKLKIHTNLQTPENKEEVFPFLLLPFVENAFKHVSGEMWIDISLEIKGSKLDYKVSNSIDSKIYSTFTKEGIGLVNLEKRLNLLYKNKFQFDVESSENEYAARLQLSVN
jgi:two-component system LytT family sensor kinase